MWDPERTLMELVDWLRAQGEQTETAGAVLGLSGGLDSSVVAGLCRRAFAGQALGLVMNCESEAADLTDARRVAEALDLSWRQIDLTGIYHSLLPTIFGRETPALPRLVLANLKSRLRMLTLYAWANRLNYLVVGTGNRDELAVGYFTKYGDGGVDLLPLGGLVKARVRQLGQALGLPERILVKPPSAGLWPGQTDEGELGLSYEALDRYLLGEEVDPAIAARIEELQAKSTHKRCLPPIAPVSQG